MTPHFSFQYRFHPAGQGIFASGTVTAVSENEESQPFHWVFDCGSASPSSLKPIIERYRDFVLDGHLDLLCISHFDKDHVSGLGALLENLDVDTVVMPYWSPIERLVVAASARKPSGEYIELVGNPVAFVLERSRSVRRIVMIGTPSDAPSNDRVLDREPSDIATSNNETLGDSQEGTWSINFYGREQSIDNALTAQTIDLAQRRGTTLAALGSQERCRATPAKIGNAHWEFLFHHKPIDSSLVESIRTEIEAKISASTTISNLLQDPSRRKEILDIYKSRLPKGESVNSTSLCVYSGPALGPLRDCWISEPSPQLPLGNNHRWNRFLPPFHRDPCSILYTGDANFKKRSNRTEISNFLTTRRWRHIAILQVPHHGSRNNWETGSAADFPHRHSVFCADETKRKPGHPHREVLLDLVYQGPLLANKAIGWSWRGVASFSQS